MSIVLDEKVMVFDMVDELVSAAAGGRRLVVAVAGLLVVLVAVLVVMAVLVPVLVVVAVVVLVAVLVRVLVAVVVPVLVLVVVLVLKQTNKRKVIKLSFQSNHHIQINVLENFKIQS
jgi:hypothetical protein